MLSDDQLIICRFQCCGIGVEIPLKTLKATPMTKFICPECEAACQYDEDDLTELVKDSFGHGPYELEFLIE